MYLFFLKEATIVARDAYFREVMISNIFLIKLITINAIIITYTKYFKILEEYLMMPQIFFYITIKF